MSRARWRYVLPVGNAALAAALIGVALEQRKTYLARSNAVAVWDYIPPAAQIAHMVNFPAFVASSGLRLVTARGAFVEAAEYLTCVVMLWYFVGLWADHRKDSVPHKRWGRTPAIAVYLCGAIYSIAVGVFAVATLMRHPLLGLAGFFWCAFLLWSFLSPLRRRTRDGIVHASS